MTREDKELLYTNLQSLGHDRGGDELVGGHLLVQLVVSVLVEQNQVVQLVPANEELATNSQTLDVATATRPTWSCPWTTSSSWPCLRLPPSSWESWKEPWRPSWGPFWPPSRLKAKYIWLRFPNSHDQRYTVG